MHVLNKQSNHVLDGEATGDKTWFLERISRLYMCSNARIDADSKMCGGIATFIPIWQPLCYISLLQFAHALVMLRDSLELDIDIQIQILNKYMVQILHMKPDNFDV